MCFVIRWLNKTGNEKSQYPHNPTVSTVHSACWGDVCTLCSHSGELSACCCTAAQQKRYRHQGVIFQLGETILSAMCVSSRVLSGPPITHTAINLKLNTYHMTDWQLLETKLIISASRSLLKHTDWWNTKRMPSIQTPVTQKCSLTKTDYRSKSGSAKQKWQAHHLCFLLFPDTSHCLEVNTTT